MISTINEIKKKDIYEYSIAFLVYTFIFHLYFLQLPISGSLPGKVDGVFHLFVVEYLYQSILSWFTEVKIGTVMYPETSFLKFGNFSPGFVLFYIPYRYITENYLWSFWGVISLVFSLNSLSFYSLLRHYKIDIKIALICSLFISFNNFIISNIDNLDGICWFLGIFSIVFSLKYFKYFKNSYLYYSILLLGFQIYFSTYLFLITSIIWGFIWLESFCNSYSKNHFKILLLSIGTVGIIISPLVYLYIYQGGLTESINPSTANAISQSASLELKDFFTYHPNTIYSQFFYKTYNNWVSKIHSAGIGFLIPLVGIIGLIKFKIFRYQWVILIIFLIISFGSDIEINNTTYALPGNLILNKLKLGELFRINIRAYYVFIFFCLIGLALILQYFQLKSKYLLIISSIIMIENYPFSLTNYETEKRIDLLDELNQEFKFKQTDIILHYPSSLFYYNRYTTKSFYKTIPDIDEQTTNEYFFMFHQIISNTNIINGVTGFIPVSRYKNQQLIEELNNEISFKRLVNNNSINIIVIHKYLLNNYGLKNEDILFLNKYCSEIFKNENFIVYIPLKK